MQVPVVWHHTLTCISVVTGGSTRTNLLLTFIPLTFTCIPLTCIPLTFMTLTYMNLTFLSVVTRVKAVCEQRDADAERCSCREMQVILTFIILTDYVTLSRRDWL